MFGSVAAGTCVGVSVFGVVLVYGVKYAIDYPDMARFERMLERPCIEGNRTTLNFWVNTTCCTADDYGHCPRWRLIREWRQYDRCCTRACAIESDDVVAGWCNFTCEHSSECCVDDRHCASDARCDRATQRCRSQRIVNLTPKTVVIRLADGRTNRYEPSGRVASVGVPSSDALPALDDDTPVATPLSIRRVDVPSSDAAAVIVERHVAETLEQYATLGYTLHSDIRESGVRVLVVDDGPESLAAAGGARVSVTRRLLDYGTVPVAVT